MRVSTQCGSSQFSYQGKICLRLFSAFCKCCFNVSLYSKVNRAIIMIESYFINGKAYLLNFYRQAKDRECCLISISFDRPLLGQFVEWKLLFVLCCVKVFFCAPQHKVICIGSSFDISFEVFHDIIIENQKSIGLRTPP